MFRVYSKVADSGDVAIQKPSLSTVGTRVPVIATTLSSFSKSGYRTLCRYPDIWPHRNRILLGGHHLGARRSFPSGLHRMIRIESALGDDASFTTKDLH